MKAITVIMRTFNSGWVVDQSLASLMGQVDINIELIIIDSGSTDSTLDIISKYKHILIKVKQSNYFPGKVLNNAITYASNETIVFINSDVVLLSPFTLKDLIKPLTDNNVAATFGRQIVRPDAELWVRDDYERAFPANENQPSWMHYSLPIASLKKSIWIKHPFYTDSWGSEDTHWGVQVKKDGYKIKYVNKSIVMHSHNYTLKQLASRRIIEGEAEVYISPAAKYSFTSMCMTFIKSSSRETLYYITHHNFLSIPYLIINRAVYSWYYYKGFNSVYNKKNRHTTYGDYQ